MKVKGPEFDFNLGMLKLHCFFRTNSEASERAVVERQARMVAASPVSHLSNSEVEDVIFDFCKWYPEFNPGSSCSVSFDPETHELVITTQDGWVVRYKKGHLARLEPPRGIVA